MIAYTVYNADAKVYIGTKVIETPYIVSINVTRSRGNPASSANVQVIYNQDHLGSVGSSPASLRIWVDGDYYFTGYIKKFTVSPSFRVAKEYILRIQAEDEMFRLINKRYTRRQKQNGIGPIAFITSIYKRTELGFDDPTQRFDIERQGSVIETITNSFNTVEHNKFLKGGEVNTFANLHPVTKVADPLIYKDTSGGAGSIGLHDHTSLDSASSPHGGGPAFAVFGTR